MNRAMMIARHTSTKARRNQYTRSGSRPGAALRRSGSIRASYEPRLRTVVTGARPSSAQAVCSLGEPYETVPDQRRAGLAHALDITQLAVRGGEESLEAAEVVEKSRCQ